MTTDNITEQALTWNPSGKHSCGRAKHKWRRRVEEKRDYDPKSCPIKISNGWPMLHLSRSSFCMALPHNQLLQ